MTIRFYLLCQLSYLHQVSEQVSVQPSHLRRITVEHRLRLLRGVDLNHQVTAFPR